MLLPDLLLMSYSVCFLTDLRITSSGMATPTVVWTPHQSLVKKMLLQACLQHDLTEHFISHLLSDDFSSC